jgi:hypothetical protein
MTLLTSKLLQQLKDRFHLRITWSLGVLRLVFRSEDGDFELHRKVRPSSAHLHSSLQIRFRTTMIRNTRSVDSWR